MQPPWRTEPEGTKEDVVVEDTDGQGNDVVEHLDGEGSQEVPQEAVPEPLEGAVEDPSVGGMVTTPVERCLLAPHRDVYDAMNDGKLVPAEEGAILPGSLNVHAEQIAVHHLTLFAVLKASGAGVGDHSSK